MSPEKTLDAIREMLDNFLSSGYPLSAELTKIVVLPLLKSEYSAELKGNLEVRHKIAVRLAIIGLSPAAFAKKIGVPRVNFYSALLSRSRENKRSTLEKICPAMGLDVDDLYDPTMKAILKPYREAKSDENQNA